MKYYFGYFKYILPYLPMLLIQFLTGKQRYLGRNEWDKRIWVANIFRLYEYIFGREVGIKKEAASWTEIEDGKYITKHEFYTLEAYLAHYEGSLRAYLTSLKYFFFHPEINWQLGAIALDVASNGTTTATTPVSWSHTCTGSNLILSIGAADDATTPSISTPTYNSVSASLVGSQRTNSVNMAALYFLVGPSTGSNTVSVGFGGTTPNCNAVAVSYSGVSQTGQPDASGGNTGASAPNPNFNTVADNCWAACVCVAVTLSGGNHTSRGGVIVLSGTNKFEYQDSNAVIHPAGNITFAWGAGSTAWAGAAGSFSPAAAAPPTGYASWLIATISQPIIANDVQIG